MTPATPLPLFAAYGIEIEYVIVDRETLRVLPLADRVLAEVAGEGACDYEEGEISWSNELVLHLLELKTTGPAPTLAGLARAFQESVGRLEALLGRHGACLLPGGMHPWMAPATETVLWPHEYAEVYRAYDRIFDCRRHGWANVQSVHVNLPFADEVEFGRLHAAVRLVLPLLPALAASSPVEEGRLSGVLDTRLVHYREHCARVPSMTGEVIPEPVRGIEEYRQRVLAPIDRELAPHDTEGTLVGHEWLNARGAIARFDRNAIEIRLLDTQECPRADLAVTAALCAAVRALVEERHAPLAAQQAFPSPPLVRLLGETIEKGPAARIENPAYARLLGAPGVRTAGEFWRALLAEEIGAPAELAEPLRVILDQGTLAERLRRALGPAPGRAELLAVYRELCACLAEGRVFTS